MLITESKRPSRRGLVAPTLVEAVKELRHLDQKGFVFIRADATERFCSFKTIDEEAERRGAHFAAHGVKKGDRVAIIVPDPDEFVLSFLGAIYAGGVPVPMYPQLSFKNVESYHDTVAHIVAASDAKLLLTTQSTKQFIEPLFVGAKPGASGGSRVPSVREMMTTDMLAAPTPGALDVKLSPDDLCFLQFTSGSTSKPKGVVVTHGNLAANSEAFMIHGLGKDSSVDKGTSWLPLFHDMGLIGFVIGPLFTEIPVVFLPTASFVRSPRVWLDAIHRHRGTITYAPNFAYALVAKRLKEKDVAGLDLSCIRIAGCGAEPIQAKTLRDFAERMKPAGFNPKAYIPSYGMAEATLAIAFAPHGQGFSTDSIDPKSLQTSETKPSTAEDAQELVACGGAFPDHEIVIVDEHGNRLGERKVGQIVTTGPSIGEGYFREPELTAEAFKKIPGDDRVWLHTGDLGYFENGRLYICGRLKDIIIIRGRNFYPNDIEWVASELPGVRRGNVVAFGVTVDANGKHVEDGTGEEHLVVCAEAFSSDAERLGEEIQKAITEEIGIAVWKVEIVPQGALPRTSSGKPQRRKTKRMFLDGTLPKRETARAGA